MANKTISIDLEAYRRLSRVKRKGETFSAVIKRVVRTPEERRALLREIDAIAIGPEVAEGALGVRPRGRVRRKAS